MRVESKVPTHGRDMRREEEALITNTARRWIWLIVLMGAVYAVGYLSVYFSDSSFDIQSGEPLVFADFWQFWAAGGMLAEHPASAVYDPVAFERWQLNLLGGEGEIYPMPYPPSMLLLVRPFALLPYGFSAIVWLGLSLGLVLWVQERKERGALPVLLFLCAPAVLVNVILGQNGFFTAALLLLGVRWMRTAPLLAGFAFGLLTMKPQLGIMIPVALLASGSWRVILSAVGTSIGMVCISSGVFGPDIWLHYLEMASNVSQQAANSSSDSGFANLQAGVGFQAMMLGFPSALAIALQAVVTLAAMVVVGWVYRTRPEHKWAGLVLMSATFLGPWSSFYDMTILALVAMSAGFTMIRTGLRPGELLGLAAIWSLPVVGIATTTMSAVYTPLVLVGFFVLLVLRAKSEGERAAA